MSKRGEANVAIFKATGAWVATVLSYTLFNYAIVLASGTLTAIAAMNFLGGVFRLPELISDHEFSSRAIIIGILGGVCMLFIAAPLWLTYQLSGGSGIILNIVYDSMLVAVFLVGPFLGLIPKPDKKGLLIIAGIASLAAFRAIYHRDQVHWTWWLVLLVFLITIGYMGFNLAVQKSNRSVATQIIMNWVASLLILICSIGLSVGASYFSIHCIVSCSAWAFTLSTNIGILLGGLAIYGIVRFLSMLYVQLNMKNVSRIHVNLSGFTMPLVYEGLVVFGAITLSYILHKGVSFVDIIISLLMLALVVEDMKHHITK